MPMSLDQWQKRLEGHFRELASTRSTAEYPIFAFEHGLSEDELDEIGDLLGSRSLPRICGLAATGSSGSSMQANSGMTMRAMNIGRLLKAMRPDGARRSAEINYGPGLQSLRHVWRSQTIGPVGDSVSHHRVADYPCDPAQVSAVAICGRPSTTFVINLPGLTLSAPNP